MSAGPRLDLSAWEALFTAGADLRIADAERRDALRLIRTPNVGPIAWRKLIAQNGGATSALAAAPETAKRGGRTARLKVATVAQADAELDRLARIGGQLLLLGDPDYPPALAALADAPPALSVIGDVGLLRRPAAALVGARNASMNGRTLAARLAGDLAKAGAVVVSGLARGIDGAAHHGALDAGGGTIAVVAGGVDVVYPHEHQDLQLAIGERGAVVAESPLGAEPTARAFPRRNRIISGLSQAVVVVEAALRSGSLITARLAGEQGREVGAAPGSPLDPRCQGGNRLIKDGAALIEDVADIIALIVQARPPTAREPAAESYAGGGPAADDDAVAKARAGLAELLSPSPALVDELVRVLHLSPAAVQIALLELELAGRLERLSGGRVALVPDVADDA